MTREFKSLRIRRSQIKTKETSTRLWLETDLTILQIGLSLVHCLNKVGIVLRRLQQISRMNACDTDKLDPELEKFKALVHKYNLFCNITIASYAAVAILVILYINL